MPCTIALLNHREGFSMKKFLLVGAALAAERPETRLHRLTATNALGRRYTDLGELT